MSWGSRAVAGVMQEAARDGQDSDVVFSKLDPSWGPEITQGATLLLLVSIY